MGKDLQLRTSILNKYCSMQIIYLASDEKDWRTAKINASFENGRG